jgi:histidyl-tRNA synthetase
MWDPPAEHPLRRLFAGLAEHAFFSHLGVADPPLIDYVSSLLSRFVHADAVFRLRGDGGRPLTELVDMLSEAGQLPAGRVEFSPAMVRGLSYYTGPIWEVSAEGVPGSLAGGGRYDHLIEQLGGPDVPATGGSLGVERLLLLLPQDADEHSWLDVAVTVMDQRYEARSFALAAAARSAGLRASVYMGASGKLGRQLRWANDQGARWSLIYGGAEEEAGTVTVRDMTTRKQTAVPASELADHLARLASEAGTG